jgi:5-methylcytosine-specific restriction protein B
MSMADDVRSYAYEHYVKPARARGATSVTIRAGDVHTALNYASRLPLVCGALGALKFQEEYGVKLLSRDGPGQSTTTTFTFGW